MSVINYILKVIVVGSHSAGKTTLVNRFIDKDNFKNVETTIGVEFCTKIINVKNNLVKIQIWDTSGQERFRSIISSYYRGASGAIICYDVNNRDEFMEVPQWIETIRKLNIDKDVTIIVVGTKIDQKKTKNVSTVELNELSDRYDVLSCEVSSYKFINIDKPFNMIAKTIINKIEDDIHFRKLNVKSVLQLEEKLIEQQYRYDNYFPKKCCNIL